MTARDDTTPVDMKDRIPRRQSRALRLLGGLILRVMGWRIAGSLPNLSKFVVIAAPHTSNWDFVVGMAATLALDVEAHWIGKHTIFRWPFRRFMTWLGGIPVNRTATTGLVEQIVDRFNSSTSLVIGLAPEGTRKKVAKWKSGFYYIAMEAGVPIVCAYFDFGAKEVGLGPILHPSGDYHTDLRRIMEFYAPIDGKNRTRL